MELDNRISWDPNAQLRHIEQRFREGDRRAILEALALCLKYESGGPEIPRGASAAFLTAFAEVSDYSVKSWDDVFGKPFPKGKSQSALKIERRVAEPLFRYVMTERFMPPQRKLNDILIEEIAEIFGLSKTRAWEYYRAYKKDNPEEYAAFSNGLIPPDNLFTGLGLTEEQKKESYLNSFIPKRQLRKV